MFSNKSILLSLIVPIALSLIACQAKKIPAFDGKIYAFSIPDRAFVRKQDHEMIHDDSAEAAQMISMKEQDWIHFLNTYILSCKQWDNALSQSIQ